MNQKGSSITHLVLKWDDIQKALSNAELTHLDQIIKHVRDYRAAVGRNSNPEYYICNKDEKYSKEVLDVILAGEGEFHPVYTVAVHFAMQLDNGDYRYSRAEFSDCNVPFTSEFFDKIKEDVLNHYITDKGCRPVKIVTITQEEYYNNTKEDGQTEKINLIHGDQTAFDRKAITRD